MALRLAEALNWRGIPSCGFCGEQENHLFVRQEENSRGKRPLNATGAVGKEVKASHVSILVCRPVCHVPVLSPSHQLLQQRVSSSSFLCRVQTLFLIAFATRAHESRALFFKERIHPSITTTPCRRPPVRLTFFCVCEFCLVARSREYFRHTSSLHFFCSLAPTGESLNQHLSVVTKRKIKIR